jgi:hypothetical protein
MRHSRTFLRTLSVIATLAGIAGGRPASAQVGPEIGVAVGGLSTADLDVRGDGAGSGNVEFHVVAPLDAKWTLEGLLAYGRSRQQRSEGAVGVLFKRYSRPEDGASMFFSIGALGLYSGLYRPQFLGPLPLIPTVGGGLRVRINERLAFEADTGALFFLWIPYGLRGTAGLSLALGRD